MTASDTQKQTHGKQYNNEKQTQIEQPQHKQTAPTQTTTIKTNKHIINKQNT